MATPSTPSIDDAIQRYLSERKMDLASRSWDCERTFLIRWAKFVQRKGPKQIARCSAADINSFFIALQDPKKCAQAGASRGPVTNGSTLNLMRTRLRTFFVWVHRQRWHPRPDLVMDARPKPFPTAAKRAFTFLSAEEMRQMVETETDIRDRTLLTLLIESGLRGSEAYRLPVGAVDFESGTISTVLHKTRKRVETPMTVGIERALREWMEHYAAEIGRPFEADDWLFPAYSKPLFTGKFDNNHKRTQTKRYLRPKNCLNHPQFIVHRAMRRIGLDVPVHEGTHTLRRSAATVFYNSLIEAGEPNAIRRVMKFLNHESQETTEIYIGINVDKAATNRLLRGNSFIIGARPENVVRLRSADTPTG